MGRRWECVEPGLLNAGADIDKDPDRPDPWKPNRKPSDLRLFDSGLLDVKSKEVPSGQLGWDMIWFLFFSLFYSIWIDAPTASSSSRLLIGGFYISVGFGRQHQDHRLEFYFFSIGFFKASTARKSPLQNISIKWTITLAQTWESNAISVSFV